MTPRIIRAMQRLRRPRLLASVVSVALIVAACGGDDDTSPDDVGDSSPTTEAPPPTTEPPTTEAATTAPPTTTPPTTAPPATVPPTTEAPQVTAAELAADGPYEVGVTTRTLESGGPVEIWYPATAEADGVTDAYAVRTFLPAAIAGLVPADLDDTFPIEAARDGAPAADGPFPVVLFSHGASSFRTQSSAIARHLASWGMVVASTDHPSRDLENSLGGTAEGQRPASDDLRELRTYLEAIPSDDPLAGVLDTGRVGLAGHSAGGGTIVDVAPDPGILGYVSYASGLRDEAPAVPSLFMAGADDQIVPLERTTTAFDAAAPPSWLWVFDEAGHLAFSDLCAVGGGEATLIDLAIAAGLEAFVDDRLRALATDGCEEPNRPVTDVWPGVHQATTGFFRWVFGIDAEPIGLDESAVTDGVTITSKP